MVATRDAYLDDASGRRRIYGQSGIIVAGVIDNLYWQEKSIPCRATAKAGATSGA